jgi:hypothetical protein
MHQITRRLSPSLMLAIVALFVALAGTAVAAGEIIITPDQIKDHVVTAPKLADDAVSSRTLANSSVRLEDLQQPVVAAGVNKGLAPGEEPFLLNPTTDVESVENSDHVNFSSGTYTVRFATPVRHCQWAATPASLDGEGTAPKFIRVRPSKFDSHEVFVFTSELQTLGSNKGSVIPGPASFYLLGRC